jgi:hypothetical protein
MSKLSENISGLLLPALFVIAWISALTNSTAPGSAVGESRTVADLRWLIYYAGYSFIASSIMHSLLAKKTAASIGWKTNGFQYEVAFVSLGLGIGCFYSINHGLQALTAISIPIISFLFLAAINHTIEIVRAKNYAPNNTLILIWDFGISISLTALLLVAN